MNVAIVILNYLTWEDTIKEAKLVHDLFELEWRQIIIVDNASPNDSVEYLRKKEIGPYIFLESKENKGYAYGNNIGLRYAYEHNYKYAWIINNDIEMNNNAILSTMISIMENNDKIAVVNPDIYSPEGYLYNRDAKKRNFWDFTFGAYIYKKKGRNILKQNGYAYVSRPQGCCMLVNIGKLNLVNYLDEHTFLYYEEMILAEKLEKIGCYCACAYNISVIHNHSKTVKQAVALKKMIAVQNESYEYYLKEYRNYGWLKRKVCLLFKTAENYIMN